MSDLRRHSGSFTYLLKQLVSEEKTLKERCASLKGRLNEVLKLA